MVEAPISADSHVVEGPEVFAGLAQRFGDHAPRIMDLGDQVDAIVIPANGMRGVSVARMGMAATRLARNEPLQRMPGHKPAVAPMDSPELVALFAKGYQGMRKGRSMAGQAGRGRVYDRPSYTYLNKVK